MKKFLHILTTCLVVSNFLTFSFSVPVQAEELDIEDTTPIYATCDIGLNIRITPGKAYDPIDTVEYGTELEKIDESSVDGWTMINYEDEVRYVYTNFTTEDEEDVLPETPPQELSYYGNCTITHYDNGACCCGKWAGGNTASGVPPTVNRTVAHNYLPFGTRILINGVEYIVEDRGDSNMAGGMWFDIYVGSHEEANQRGMYQAEVYIIN